MKRLVARASELLSRWRYGGAEDVRVKFRSGAWPSFNMLSEQVVDEGLVAQPSPLGLSSHSVEDLGIDPNGD